MGPWPWWHHKDRDPHTACPSDHMRWGRVCGGGEEGQEGVGGCYVVPYLNGLGSIMRIGVDTARPSYHMSRGLGGVMLCLT